MTFHDQKIEQTETAAICPFHALPVVSGIQPDDILTLTHPKRMVVQRAFNDDGVEELHLYYGDKEISFDEPELFSFGENLARQTRFQASTSLTWGEDFSWEQIGELLSQLVQAGVLIKGAELDLTFAADRSRPSPLKPAQHATPQYWDRCEAVTQTLTGVAIEEGHLEKFIPVFRVAHAAFDSDGRQVGEANVFPPALRMDTLTEWMACIYPGTRYGVDRPMNVTALKAMREHWPQMMAALSFIRARFIQRFPEVAEGWTIGSLERLAVLVLAVPSFQLMRKDNPVASGNLHPALSSMFRVTDGLRMTMHQMLFVPIGEAAKPAETPMTSTEIHAYAERNYSFHSETGVCAGPKIMVEEFLRVLVDGYAPAGAETFQFDADVRQALDSIERAFDYGLYGLRVFAPVFCLWPAMADCYEQLAASVNDAEGAGVSTYAIAGERLNAVLSRVKLATFLADPVWRQARLAVFTEMYSQCGKGLGGSGPRLDQALEMRPPHEALAVQNAIALHLAHAASDQPNDRLHHDRVAGVLADFCLKMQAVLRLADENQREINTILGRAKPERDFGSREINTHNLLQDQSRPHLPYLMDELEAIFGLSITVTQQTISIQQPDANPGQTAA